MKSVWRRLSEIQSLSALSRSLSLSRRNSVTPIIPDSYPPSESLNLRPDGIPPLFIPPTNQNSTGDITSSPRRDTAVSARVGSAGLVSARADSARLVSAVLGFRTPFEPVQGVASIDNSLDTEPEEGPVIENSKYNYSPFIPFDHRESQSRESPDNLVSKPRYNNMIFFDPEENSDSPRGTGDQRRKKFLTVISANSILPHASPSTSPSKQTEIPATVIQNTYQQSLKKMKDILLGIENLRYDKNEIIEACQYARQFKGIMNGRDGVIRELKRKNSELVKDEIEAKFERLKTISFLFQQKCSENNIFSGRDENSLKSQYKFANGKNNRPGLRLTYITDEVLKMYERHNEATAVELSARPAAPIISSSPRSRRSPKLSPR